MSSTAAFRELRRKGRFQRSVNSLLHYVRETDCQVHRYLIYCQVTVVLATEDGGECSDLNVRTNRKISKRKDTTTTEENENKIKRQQRKPIKEGKG